MLLGVMQWGYPFEPFPFIVLKILTKNAEADEESLIHCLTILIENPIASTGALLSRVDQSGTLPVSHQ